MCMYAHIAHEDYETEQRKNGGMELLVFPTKVNRFVAVLLQCTGVEEVKLATVGRDEVRLNFTLLYVSHRERNV